MYKPFVKILSRLAEESEGDKLKMFASKDFQGNTYDWNELVNRIYKLDDKIVIIQ
jgi:hypothetical protein